MQIVTDRFLKMIPLGGMGEFGMNSLAVYCGQSIIVIDAGMLFPKDDLLGVDLVIPDFEFLREDREKVRAILLTHGHEDHIGALPYLLKTVSAPVYGTPLTLGFAKGRLADHGVLEETELISVQPRDVLEFEDLKIEFIRMTHSIADSLGFVLETPAGTIIHTGDFKLDQSPPNSNATDYARLSHYGERGVLALLSDSTNSERPGFTPSENYVRRHIEQIFYTCKGKIILACFASSIHRIQIILDLAGSFGRKVVPVGRSMKQNISIAADLGYLKIPNGVLVDIVESRSLDASELVVLSTGTQGEPMAALTRLAFGNHKDFTVEEDDAIILSARVIPGNESRVSRLVNHFCRRGARVYDEGRWSTHVSGHASQEEQKLLLNIVRPKHFIPIHGELRQLKRHAYLAKQVGIPEDEILVVENGEVVELVDGKLKKGERIPGGYVFVDGQSIGDIDHGVMREREKLARGGIFLIDLNVDKYSGRLLGEPEILTRGFLSPDDANELLPDVRQRIMDIVNGGGLNAEKDIASAVKSFLYNETKRRPMVFVTLSKA